MAYNLLMANEDEDRGTHAEAVPGEADASTGDVMAISDAAEARNSLAWLPLVLGLFVIAVDILLLARLKPGFFLSRSLPNSVAGVLLLTSLLVGAFLIAYSAILRNRNFGGDDSHSFGKRVVLPLILGLLAPLLTVWGLEVVQSSRDSAPQVSCTELYQMAQTTRKDNPKFRMPGNDRDERRCGINKVLGI